MFCPKCGKELREYERSCPYCGAAAAHGRGNRHRIKPMELIAIAAGVLALLLACTVLVYQIAQRKKEARWKELTVDRREAAAVVPVEPLTRQQFLSFTAADMQTAAAVPDYSVSGDLHEITNLEWMEWNGLSDTAKAILAQNLFVVEPDFYSEFFGRYEWNRYLQIPNFVTVDSMMHTYHLYFSLLLNRTEKQQLAAQLQTLSKDMLRASAAQLDALTGTAWENAAKRSTAYFAVGAALQDPKIQVPEQVKDAAAQELSAIYAAEGIAPCAVTEDLLDYSQFKPRGYYEGDETLETYFRAMMWYGQINFTQKKEDMNRTALLITLALHDTASDSWEKLYAVTSFFAGVSDDLGYYEYLPAIEAAYGTIPDTELLRLDETAYQHYTEQIRTLAAPQINSIPVVDPDGTVNLAEEGKGFRFMGQRFTLDAAVMQQLVFNKVRENAQGERRMLPDVLDMPAALGSETALSLLTRDAELVQPSKMLLNFHHQFIVDRLCGRTLRNAGWRHIVKAMLIVDIARAGLQPRRLAADVRVPLPDHPCRISLQRQIDIRKLKRSSVPALQAVQPSAIVLFFIRGVRTPADPRLKPDHRDRVLACIILDGNFPHCSFLLFCTNAVMQF